MTNPALKDVVRTSLETVEQSAEPGRDDIAVSELTQTVVRSVAELDTKVDEKNRPNVRLVIDCYALFLTGFGIVLVNNSIGVTTVNSSGVTRYFLIAGDSLRICQ